jgi:hypothetical protein
MRVVTLSLLGAAGVATLLVSASICSAVAPGPDLTGSWRSVRMLAPAPKPNYSTILEGVFVVRNDGDRVARGARAVVYLRPDRTDLDVRDARVSRQIRVFDLPTLVPGQRWNGRVAPKLEPGLDYTGLRLTVVVDTGRGARDVNPANDQVTSDPISEYRDLSFPQYQDWSQ